MTLRCIDSWHLKPPLKEPLMTSFSPQLISRVVAEFAKLHQNFFLCVEKWEFFYFTLQRLSKRWSSLSFQIMCWVKFGSCQMLTKTECWMLTNSPWQCIWSASKWTDTICPRNSRFTWCLLLSEDFDLIAKNVTAKHKKQQVIFLYKKIV